MSNIAPEDRKFQRWMTQWWRPAMAYMYMFICFFDFFLAPVLWSLLQVYQGTRITEQWMPITLQGAGMFHVAMGAILGVAAWGRSQEKMAILGNQQGMMAYNQGMGGMQQGYGGGMYGGGYGQGMQQPPRYPQRAPVQTMPQTSEPKDPPTRDNKDKGEIVYGREE